MFTAVQSIRSRWQTAPPSHSSPHDAWTRSRGKWNFKRGNFLVFDTFRMFLFCRSTSPGAWLWICFWFCTPSPARRVSLRRQDGYKITTHSIAACISGVGSATLSDSMLCTKRRIHPTRSSARSAPQTTHKRHQHRVSRVCAGIHS